MEVIIVLRAMFLLLVLADKGRRAIMLYTTEKWK
jgi:hypothetical protein